MMGETCEFSRCIVAALAESVRKHESAEEMNSLMVPSVNYGQVLLSWRDPSTKLNILQLATAINNAAAVKLLLTQWPQLTKVDRNPLLHLTCYFGNTAIARYLVDEMDVDIFELGEVTKDLGYVKLTHNDKHINLGQSNVTKENSDKTSYLDVSCRPSDCLLSKFHQASDSSGYPGIPQTVEHRNPMTPYMICISQGNFECADYIIYQILLYHIKHNSIFLQKINKEMPTENLRLSSLQRIAFMGHSDHLRWLLGRRVAKKASHIDYDEITLECKELLLQIALISGNIATFKSLLKDGIVNSMSDSQSSILHYMYMYAPDAVLVSCTTAFLSSVDSNIIKRHLKKLDENSNTALDYLLFRPVLPLPSHSIHFSNIMQIRHFPKSCLCKVCIWHNSKTNSHDKYVSSFSGTTVQCNQFILDSSTTICSLCLQLNDSQNENCILKSDIFKTVFESSRPIKITSQSKQCVTCPARSFDPVLECLASLLHAGAPTLVQGYGTNTPDHSVLSTALYSKKKLVYTMDPDLAFISNACQMVLKTGINVNTQTRRNNNTFIELLLLKSHIRMANIDTHYFDKWLYDTVVMFLLNGAAVDILIGPPVHQGAHNDVHRRWNIYPVMVALQERLTINIIHALYNFMGVMHISRCVRLVEDKHFWHSMTWCLDDANGRRDEKLRRVWYTLSRPNPRTLRHLAKITILISLGRKGNRIYQLPFPPKLQCFVNSAQF